MNKIKNIIFDYGNVIFELDFERLKKEFAALGIQDANTIFSHTKQNSLFDQFDLGLIGQSEFFDSVRKLAKNEELQDYDVCKAWNSLLVGVPIGNHEVLLDLKAKYRTFLLSNNNEIHYAAIHAHLKEDYDVESNSVFFEKDYYSHLMKMRKPNHDIFEFMIDEHGLKAEETLFIDDSPQHHVTAKELGLNTILFDKPKELKQLIEELGL